MVAAGMERLSVHETPAWILNAQAARLGLPLYEIPISAPCPRGEYEASMQRFLARVHSLPPGRRSQVLAYGDLFLEDIRQYREAGLRGTGFTPLVPLWGRLTAAALVDEMISAGVKAIVTAISPVALLVELAGRWFDRSFLADLPSDVDALGENGEFHTCVVAGPMFSSAIGVRVGEMVVSTSVDGAGSGNPHPSYAYVELLRPDRDHRIGHRLVSL